MSAESIDRRGFVASVTAGIAVTAASAAGLEVVETNVEIKTPDGACDAAFIHPKSGSHPGVLIWPDAFGLRPAMRDMAKRLAADGYSVLVPNPFYRVSKAPFTDASQFDFGKPEDRAKLQAGYEALIEKLAPLVQAGLAAAIYTQTTDVEGEVNGLMTYDRQMIKYDAAKLNEMHRKLIQSVAR